MIFRTIAIALIGLALGLSAFVFEAALSAAAGANAFDAARVSDSTIVRTRIANTALARLEGSWAHPLSWHAGAAEIASGLYALRADAAKTAAAADAADAGQGGGAEAHIAADYAQSAALAARAVALSPVLPRAWLRLAMLGADGHANALCAPQACLEQSWRLAPIVDADTQCLRLQTAYRLGAHDAARAHLGDYLRAPAPLRSKAQCLAPVMAPGELFTALLGVNQSAPGAPR